MKLKLNRPIIFFDLETTGIDIVRDRIVEISMVKLFPDGSKDIKTRRINPLMPIPASATAVHGISDEDVKDCNTFAQIAKSLAQFMEGCDMAGYNSNKFDVPMLQEEFLRVGVGVDFSKRKFVDVQTIFHKMEQRTLTAAYKFYCGKVIENAHSAEADTLATMEVLFGQLDKYESELEANVDFLAEFSKQNRNVDFAGRIVLNDQDRAVFNFGKHRGVAVEDVFAKEPSYYDWIMKGDFTLDTKQVATRLRLGVKNN